MSRCVSLRLNPLLQFLTENSDREGILNIDHNHILALSTSSFPGSVLNTFTPIESSAMKLNMGIIDRALRGLVATVLIVLILSSSIAGGWKIVAWIVSIIFITTSIIGICPLYKLLGINTGSRNTTDK